MSRAKNVNNYYREQERKKQQEAAKKRNRILLIVVAAVLLVAIVLTVIFSFVLKKDPIKVVIDVEKYGKITLELYPDVAPISVENFVNYVEEGFYDGLTFHRVIEGFMIQGGDPSGTGFGDSSLKTIKGEFSENGVKNNLSFKRGVIGMARSNDYNSATSQFFICHEDSDHLDGYYAAFGRVIDGMEVVDSIAVCDKTTKVDSNGTQYEPAEKIVIKSAYVLK